MRIVVVLLGFVTFLIGVEVFNFGSLVSRYFVYGCYLFILVHIAVIYGLVRNTYLAKVVFIGENILFVICTSYYIYIFPKLHFGMPSESLTRPVLHDYLHAAKFGILPMALYLINIAAACLSIRKA